MSQTKEKHNITLSALGNTFGYKNALEMPRLQKVVISASTGSVKDKKKIELIQDRLAKITGQKTAPRGAKKSVAAFKIREGDTIGYQVTLRGKRMYDFLDRLLHIALPRARDFRGLSRESVDLMGNVTIGIREHTIFPETGDEDIKDVFGFAITVVTTANNKKDALAFLEHLGFPFKKEDIKK
ncbi:50S ribosomal protein L5 [Patescibacteria group bacterium]|nr:50S ribosomal protein L5 [Patescibacteria group bacterium]